MGVLIQNEQVVGGLDAAVAAKIGNATLTTTASDLSGAVNELDAELGNETLPDPSKTVKGNINSLKQSLSVKSTIVSGRTTSSGALSLPSNLLGKALVDCHYKKDTNIGLVYRRDYYYLTCLAASMNPFANTQVDVEVLYLDV